MVIKLVKTLCALALLAAAFAGGYVLRATKSPAAAGGRRILYYVDPMHPAYRSDGPGVAPDCGMQLEPVYADDPAGTHGKSAQASAPNTVRISSDRQQLIGVRIDEVKKTSSVTASTELRKPDDPSQQAVACLRPLHMNVVYRLRVVLNDCPRDPAQIADRIIPW